MAADKKLKDKLNELVSSTPDMAQLIKDGIKNDLETLIRISKSKKSPFKSSLDRIEKLTSLIQQIAGVDFTDSEIEGYKVVFKNSFHLTKEHFDKIYKEKRSAFIRERNLKKKWEKEDAVNRKLSETKTSLLDIHAILADVSSASHDMIELAMAVAISLHISTKYSLALLWMLLVGPPSSDKTASVTTIRDVPAVYHLDTLTENSFISGYVAEDGSATQDLLAELDQKCFVVKDFTTLFSLKADTIRKILGDMCAIYDKVFAKFTGTRGRVQYEASFSHLGCITPVALAGHQEYLNMIGPRFLFYRVLPLTESQLAEGFDIAWSGHERKVKVQQLRDSVSAYVWQIQQNIPDLAPETEDQKNKLNSLAELLRHGRAVIRTEVTTGKSKKGNFFTSYEPAEVQVEEPWRALQQIQVLTRALAVIHKRNRITDHEIELARRVVMSSMPVDRADVLCLFQREEVRKNGMRITRKRCIELIKKNYNQVQRILTELKCIGLLEVSKEGEEWVYKPAQKFSELVTEPMNNLDHVADLTDN